MQIEIYKQKQEMSNFTREIAELKLRAREHTRIKQIKLKGIRKIRCKKNFNNIKLKLSLWKQFMLKFIKIKRF